MWRGLCGLHLTSLCPSFSICKYCVCLCANKDTFNTEIFEKKLRDFIICKYCFRIHIMTLLCVQLKSGHKENSVFSLSFVGIDRMHVLSNTILEQKSLVQRLQRPNYITIMLGPTTWPVDVRRQRMCADKLCACPTFLVAACVVVQHTWGSRTNLKRSGAASNVCVVWWWWGV